MRTCCLIYIAVTRPYRKQTQVTSVWFWPPGLSGRVAFFARQQCGHVGEDQRREIPMLIPDCVLVQQPAIDFGTFLGISREALEDYSPADASDGSARELSDAERWLSCLAAMHDTQAAVGLVPTLLTHVMFSVLIVVDDRDALDVFSIGAGMPFVVAETVNRGTLLAVMSGTLSQWRDAVKTGTAIRHETNVRAFYCKVLVRFGGSGPGLPRLAGLRSGRPAPRIVCPST